MVKFFCSENRKCEETRGHLNTTEQESNWTSLEHLLRVFSFRKIIVYARTHGAVIAEGIFDLNPFKKRPMIISGNWFTMHVFQTLNFGETVVKVLLERILLEMIEKHKGLTNDGSLHFVSGLTVLEDQWFSNSINDRGTRLLSST
ncbi:uncharacterized protein LOC129757658 [Uranotaenia lowii]|uniref:uncharacterized protein LOC129757658 n=1 Tax=Uranotaenia lowii TaxID=190385 RepID=UPI0024791E40|nr:uncharacterized protein LOC129757658 [Uranotaenia lowii]